jgi:hypothetical protein
MASTLTKLPIDSLLLSGSTILNTFQITEALDDPVTRTAALLSLICALMSGCIMYIVKIGMRKERELRSCVERLGMPVVWMSWWVPKQQKRLSHIKFLAELWFYLYLLFFLLCGGLGRFSPWRSGSMCFIIGTSICGHDIEVSVEENRERKVLLFDQGRNEDNKALAADGDIGGRNTTKGIWIGF